MQEEINFPKLPPLFIIRATGGFRAFLKRLHNRIFPQQFVLMEYATSFWMSRAIGVAAELNIADLLIDGEKSIQFLAEKTDCKEETLYRLLRALASEGIFKETKDHHFALTKMAEALRGDQKSMKYFVLHHLSQDNWELFGELKHCVRTGENAIKKLHNCEPFEYLQSRPENYKIFNQAMSESSEMAIVTFVKDYPFSKFKTIVDVGGGYGFLLSCILYLNNEIKGVVFDLPEALKDTEKTFKKFGIEERAKAIKGSFFENVPNEGDCYILKNVLHDWSDDDCVRILSNIHANMPNDAKLLVIETIIKKDNKPSFGKTLDLQMMVGTTGGKERTLDEYSTLFNLAGFNLIRVIPNATPFSFIEGIKK